MNHSKLYVPDPTFWVNFFKNKSRKKFINQKGGNNTISAKQSSDEQPMNVDLVSPVEAADQRTETTIKRLRKKPRPMQRRRKRINRKKKTPAIRRRKKGGSKRRKVVKRKSKKRKSIRTKRDIFN